MAVITGAELRQFLSEAQGDRWAAVTTGAGSATTTVDSKLAQLTSDDDYFIGWWAFNPADRESRLVTDYVASTTTLTHVAFSNAVGNGNDYELHAIDPTLKHAALSHASEEVWPGGGGRRGLYIPLRDESIVVDNLVTNMDGEVFSGGFTGWTEVAGTWSQETTIVYHGSNSFKGVASGAAAQQYQIITLNQKEVTEKTVKVKVATYATAASSVRARVSFDEGSTFTDLDYHSGTDQWEEQSEDIAIPDDATSYRLYQEIADGETGYFDLMRSWVDPITRYTLPTDMLRGPFQVYQQADEDDPGGPYRLIPAGYTVTEGRILRLTGMGMLSQPTTEAGTVELTTLQTAYFIAVAARYLTRTLMHSPQTAMRERERYREQLKDWEADIARFERSSGHTMPPSPDGAGAELPMGVWRVGADVDGRYIEFHRRGLTAW